MLNDPPVNDICPYCHIDLVVKPVSTYFDGHGNPTKLRWGKGMVGISSTVQDVQCRKCHSTWSKKSRYDSQTGEYREARYWRFSR